MTQVNWKLANYIYGLLVKDDNANEADRMCERINYWITLKNINGADTIRSDVEQLDVSAMRQQFTVAKYALLDDFDMVVQSLKVSLETNEIPAWCIKEWPLLLQFRETEQYSSFVQRHPELMNKMGYESNNEVIGDSQDIMRELGSSDSCLLEKELDEPK